MVPALFTQDIDDRMVLGHPGNKPAQCATVAEITAIAGEFTTAGLDGLFHLAAGLFKRGTDADNIGARLQPNQRP